MGHSTTTRYPRRGRLTRLGPPKRTSRLSGDSLEEPASEVDTPPTDSQRPVSALSSILSMNDTQDDNAPEPRPAQRPTSLSVHGQYTPPASQSTPLAFEKPNSSPVLDERQLSTPEYRDPLVRRVTGTSPSVSSSSTGSKGGSTAPRSFGRSSLRALIASTSASQKQPIDVALVTVQKGIEALTVRRQDESQPRLAKVHQQAPFW